MRLKFDVEHPGEPNAGISSYTDTVIVDVESGDPGGDHDEFMEYMQSALSEWFDGAGVGAENITLKQ
ncbi:hypothetical protein KAR91_12095 [Candidatus Pacearchaeota archaeon]|nr:hypothetical protein [Candidatus Pacearchaeota archaeon]